MHPDDVWRDYLGPELYKDMKTHNCSEAAVKAAYDFIISNFELITIALKDIKPCSYATITRDMEQKVPPIYTTISCEDEAHNLTNVQDIPDVPERNILCMSSFISVSNN